jgi:hypothetical protein
MFFRSDPPLSLGELGKSLLARSEIPAQAKIVPENSLQSRAGNFCQKESKTSRLRTPKIDATGQNAKKSLFFRC